MALDGDADGLKFYRTIAEHWCEKLAPDGFVAVEVGIGQAEDVAALFAACGLENTGIYPDLAGIPRVVLAQKQKIRTNVQILLAICNGLCYNVTNDSSTERNDYDGSKG